MDLTSSFGERDLGNSKTRYRYQKKAWDEAIELLGLIAEAIGQPLDALMGAGVEADVGKLFGGILGSVRNPKLLVRIIEQVNKGGFIITKGADGKTAMLPLSVAASEHFTAHIDELPLWLAFALEVQFSGFFGSLGGLAKSAVEWAVKKSQEVAAKSGRKSPLLSLINGLSSDSPQTSE